MDVRVKLLALAFAAPLALAACEEEGAQVGEVEEPVVDEEAAGIAEESEETQAAPIPEEPAGEAEQ